MNHANLRKRVKKIWQVLRKNGTTAISVLALLASAFALWQSHEVARFQQRVNLQDRLISIVQRGGSLYPFLLDDKAEYAQVTMEAKLLTELYPESAQAHFILGQLAVQDNDFETGFESFDRAVKLDESMYLPVMNEQLGFWMRTARKYGTDYEHVKNLAYEILEDHPDSTVGLYWAAAAHLAQEEFEEAETFADLLNLQSGFSCDGRVEYANLKKTIGKPKESKRLFLEGLPLCRDSSPFLMNLGHLHFYLKEYEQALYLYLRSIEIEPNYIGAKHSAVNVLLRLGRFSESKDFLEQAKLMPFGQYDPQTSYLEGVLSQYTGDCNSAVTHYERALELTDEGYHSEVPTPPYVIFLSLAECSYHLDQLSAAIEYFDRATEGASDSDVWFHEAAKSVANTLGIDRGEQ